MPNVKNFPQVNGMDQRSVPFDFQVNICAKFKEIPSKRSQDIAFTVISKHEITVTFEHKNLVSSSLSPGGHLCQM